MMLSRSGRVLRVRALRVRVLRVRVLRVRVLRAGGTRRRDALLALAAVTAAALLLAGCGGSSSTPAGSSQASAGQATSAQAIQRAAYVSSSASGYRLTVHLRESSAALGGDIVGTGTGAFNLPRRAGSMALRLTMPGTLSVLGPVSLHEVLSGQKVYLELPPALATKLPGGKPWLELNLAQAGKAVGIQNLTSLTGGPSSTNPGQFLQYLRATSASGVHKLGSQVVNGFRTTHYRATIELRKAPDLAPAAQRAAMRRAVASLQKLTGLRTLPVDVWVDSQHLVRRLAMSYRAAISGQSVTTHMRLDFTSYGAQPVPALPPAGQVSNISALLSQLGSAGIS